MMEILFRVRVRGKRKETSQAAKASKIVHKLIIRIKYNQFTEQQIVRICKRIQTHNPQLWNAAVFQHIIQNIIHIDKLTLPKLIQILFTTSLLLTIP
jgi:hypothetical protein